ncbi:MAG TPA: glycosyltransferase family 25 protein [Pyrinomonadaceae bacterium]|nr:glycosyltransferase family 25 protein [Pyrinomonadaceae bacterium]
MNVNDFFPDKVCINLDRRSDRWERMRARFAEHNIEDVVRFPALDGKSLDIPETWSDFPGAYGCLRSHLKVVEQARAEAKSSVLIFEDDAVLAPEFNARFAEYINQVPDDWDMILFGGIHGEPPSRISPNVTRVSHSLSTYTYALNHTIYDGFIDINRRALTLLDQNTRSLQKTFNCYCFMPHLAWVEEDFSDVREERSNLWWLSQSLVLFGKEVDEILEKTAAVIFHRGNNEAARRNLKFIVEYFAAKLPTVSLLVVEQGEKPSLDHSELPVDCQQEFLDASGGCQRSAAFSLGFSHFELSREFFIFLDSDIFLTREDIRGNLLKCREFDFASSFSEVCDLNEDHTNRILNNDLRWDYQGNHDVRRQSGICESACVFTSTGLRLIGGWADNDGELAEVTAERVRRSLKIYDSPNPARRLYS